MQTCLRFVVVLVFLPTAVNAATYGGGANTGFGIDLPEVSYVSSLGRHIVSAYYDW